MSHAAGHPVAGRDYPRTLQEFSTWFATEESCRDYVQSIRWPDGFECPSCGARKGWRNGRGYIQCADCQRQTSPTAGTLFHGTRYPLGDWLQVIWFVTAQKPGASALGIQKMLGLGSYHTAWAWLHKLRRAMVRPGRERLTGEVEVDETYFGGHDPGRDARSVGRKCIVMIAAEIRGSGTGRIRMKTVPDASAKSLTAFVVESVENGAVVHTDGWDGYRQLGAAGYDHRATSLRKIGAKGHMVLPRVHRVASLIDRWWLGTYQGAITQKHLDYYLDEFTFRYNRRTSASRGLLFYRLLQQAIHMEPVATTEVVGGTSNH